MSSELTRDDLANLYLEQLPYEPYPVQEEALLAWFTSDEGVLVCAPTGTGKTLIAEAALFEALHNGGTAYYTTPLIALTEQKFAELQEAAERWGFSRDDVGLVTGNRRVNPEARILVVVAEILLNRLLHREAFDFAEVDAVVMDEFHSFNDPERGIVWEFSLGMLPKTTRLLLLSATVGNSREFVQWLRTSHDRKVELVEGTERKVPLTYEWVGDELLADQLERMFEGEEPNQRTPALVFCFNRDQCWTVAEQLKGKRLVGDQQQKDLVARLSEHDWSEGAGPKLRQILMRGIGVHHAGVLPKYRRIVEDLFQQKLLSVAVCTETLSAGVNLPARSVVLPSLIKGPPGEKKLLNPSDAHQMFGRAGRPQFDTQGYVYALAHEDDVKHLRWKEKYDQIPEDTKDPGLRKAKKNLKKKMPKRRSTEQYWTEEQFQKLQDAAPAKLASRGDLPWRFLAYVLEACPDVAPLREVVSKRLLKGKRLEQAQKSLDRMLLTLWSAGYVELEPEPPRQAPEAEGEEPTSAETDALDAYQAERAHALPPLSKLLMLRGINPLYGVFLVNQLGIADGAERLQALESVLEVPGSVARFARVPKQDELPPGPLATTRLDVQLLQLGLASAEELGAVEKDEEEEEQDRRRGMWDEEPVWVLHLADKLKLLFDHDFPGVHDVRIRPVWIAGEILEFGGNFNKYITSKGLQKQEGVFFRHLLRLILLIYEVQQLCPPDVDEEEWTGWLDDVANRLAEACRTVDPSSTDKAIQEWQQQTTDVED